MSGSHVTANKAVGVPLEGTRGSPGHATSTAKGKFVPECNPALSIGDHDSS